MSTFIRESGKYKPYELQHRWRRRLFTFVKLLVFVFLFFCIIRIFFLSSFRVQTSSMEPSFSPKECVFITPFTYGPRIPFTSNRFFTIRTPARGDVVLYMPRAAAPQRIISKILDPVVRFFTLNRVYSISPDLRQQVPKVMIKRVLAIPGDSVKIEKNSILVKPSNEKFYLKETQSTPVLYRFQEEDSPVTHEETAVSREITLGKNEYYLAGDNRPESNDSRDFGPVDFSSIIGRVIFRYWPLRKISAF